MIEFSIIVSLLLFLTMGAIDFSFAFFQWNTATKAVQLGARLAAVSDPVCPGLSTWDSTAGGTLDHTKPPPLFSWVYNGETGVCNVDDAPDLDALNNLVYGRGDTNLQCQVQNGIGNFPGMCDIFPKIKPENIIVRYTGTGHLGYPERPGGAVPTITVEITGLFFNFMLMNGVLGLSQIPMPRLHTTVTGEDLSTSGS